MVPVKVLAHLLHLDTSARKDRDVEYHDGAHDQIRTLTLVWSRSEVSAVGTDHRSTPASMEEQACYAHYADLPQQLPHRLNPCE